MKIAIGCDHAAYKEKKILSEFLRNELKHEVVDFGTDSSESVDYPSYGHRVGKSVANKEADKQKRETVDARNQADSIIFSTEKSLKEHGDKISEQEKKAIETGVSDSRNALKWTDTEEVKKKTQDLIQVSMKLGEAVYKSQQKDEPGNLEIHLITLKIQKLKKTIKRM